MKLLELEPQFLRYEPGFMHYVPTLAEAQGIRFLCPKCFLANKGKVGTHGVICWSSSRGVPDIAQPGPGRWKMSGTGYQDLTLSAEPGKSDSVLLLAGCVWHGFVRNGEITNA